MKIVIDIPEAYYHFCKRCAVNRTAYPEQRIIASGTPLPKGHGRLIDETKITACEWDGKQMTCNAPTIIEADRGEE